MTIALTIRAPRRLDSVACVETWILHSPSDSAPPAPPASITFASLSSPLSLPLALSHPPFSLPVSFLLSCVPPVLPTLFPSSPFPYLWLIIYIYARHCAIIMTISIGSPSRSFSSFSSPGGASRVFFMQFYHDYIIDNVDVRYSDLFSVEIIYAT